MTSDLPPDGPTGRDQLREEAAQWFARMRGEDADRHRPAFEAWLARGALHRAAYNRVGEIFAAGKMLRREDLDEPSGPPSPLPGGVVAIVAILAVAVCIALALYLVDRPTADVDHASTKAAAQQASALGEIRRIRLPGGVHAVLDSDTLLSGTNRQPGQIARLERGRARFSVGAGEPPLLILAATSIVSVAGSIVDLTVRDDGSIAATVLRGAVLVRPVASAGQSARGRRQRVVAGECYRIDALGQASLQPAAPSDWPNGILEFRATPLHAVLDEANRYAAVKIVLADPALGQRTVSGRFRISDPVRLATRLASALSLDVDRRQHGIIVLRQRE